jgi:hypothetical protein
MVNDLNIGGVFIPGLLMVALAALVCTLGLVALFSQQALPALAVSPADGCFNLDCHLFPADAGPDRVGVIVMKSLLSLLARYALTLSAVAAATLLAFMMWKHYAQTPWTRDGRVRADVVQIAPDVSGPVISVAVRDNSG